MTNIVETHAHLDLKLFDGIRDELFQEMENQGISEIIVPAISLESNQSMREKLDKFSNDKIKIYYAHGVHPTRVPVGCHVDTVKKITKMLKQYADRNDCVAVGETGIDYHKESLWNCIEDQKLWFKQQLSIAKEFNKPLILHVRGMENSRNESSDRTLSCAKVINEEIGVKRQRYLDADEEAIQILIHNRPENGYRGVIHCFHGDLKIAKQYIDLGFCLGIGGKVTYDEEAELRETIHQVDLEKIVLETDSPYVQLQGVLGKINTPLNLKQIAEKVAEIKGISVEEVVKVTTDTAKRVFGI